MNKPLNTGSTDDTSLWLIAVRDKGDKAAFISLFHHFAPRIKGYLRRQGLDDAGAEDLTQDIMLQIWTKAGLFDPAKAKASTWLFTMARNRLIDHWRKTRNQQTEALNPTLLDTQSLDPHHAFDAAEDSARIHAALQSLPKAQRELVEESFLKEHSHQMIAKARGIPLGTVKSRLRLALEKLRKSLATPTGNKASKVIP